MNDSDELNDYNFIAAEKMARDQQTFNDIVFHCFGSMQVENRINIFPESVQFHSILHANLCIELIRIFLKSCYSIHQVGETIHSIFKIKTNEYV